MAARFICTGVVVPIGQARRRLPELVRKVAHGHPPVGIGRRGKVEAVLSAPPGPMQAKRRPLRGLATLVPEDLEAANEEMLEMFHASVSRTVRQLEGRARKTRRKRARAR